MGRLGTEHEDDRPGHAEMSEEHLAEMRGSFLAPLPQRRFDIAQGQARQGVRPGFFRRKGNERRFQLRHAVSQAAGKAVAVACRAGDGIGHAARRDDTGVAFVIPRRRTDDHAAAPGLDGVDGVAQMEVDALLAELAIEELAHFDGTVRLGEDAAAPFLLGSQAPGMQFIQQILIGKLFIRTVEEFAVARRMGDEIGHAARIGQIAAALAGNAQLLADDIIFFK